MWCYFSSHLNDPSWVLIGRQWIIAGFKSSPGSYQGSVSSGWRIGAKRNEDAVISAFTTRRLQEEAVSFWGDWGMTVGGQKKTVPPTVPSVCHFGKDDGLYYPPSNLSTSPGLSCLMNGGLKVCIHLFPSMALKNLQRKHSSSSFHMNVRIVEKCRSEPLLSWVLLPLLKQPQSFIVLQFVFMWEFKWTIFMINKAFFSFHKETRVSASYWIGLIRTNLLKLTPSFEK